MYVNMNLKQRGVVLIDFIMLIKIFLVSEIRSAQNRNIMLFTYLWVDFMQDLWHCQKSVIPCMIVVL